MQNSTASSMPATPALSPRVAALREAALHKKQWDGIPALPLIEARAWQERPAGEDWLLWRARRVATRLGEMPIDLSPGELVVGRPEFRAATDEETRKIESVQDILGSIPPFPGGDSGHFHPDYEKVFRVGIGGIADEIRERREKAETDEQRTFYDACEIAIEGMSTYARRVGDACDAMAKKDGDYADDWRELADICRRVATQPPATFHEAMQLMFLNIIALWFGEGHGLTAPGRLDQTLRPFYEADLAAGRITRERAFDLICGLYVQCNMILHPGSAVGVIIGGRDAEGRDVTNDLTYLCLEARLATKLVYPTVGLAWHEGTPPELTDFGCRMLGTGLGCPAFFNDELISVGLRDHGVSEADSYNYVNSTCVEIKVAGASHIWVTAPYFNCPEALLDVMHAAADGAMPEPETFDELNALVRENLAQKISTTASRLDEVWRRRAETGCFPLASCVISDCLERGLDFDRGGARYNWVENSFVGLANLVDSLLAVRRLVYESNELTLAGLRQILEADYEGSEPLRRRILNDFPSYGADNEEADALAVEWAEFLSAATASNTVGPHAYVPGFFCWVMHGRMGDRTGATPDGRKAGVPLADGAGAAQGRETAGPTASVLSTTKWSHREVLGGLVHNLRLSANVLRTGRDIAALRGLIETYLKRGGFEIQVNVVSTETLRDAQEHPEDHADLLVRVAGYSDYFVHLSHQMQGEIIARNEHTRL